MKIDILLEKYLDSFKERGHVYEVFMNPSKREMREATNSGVLRFVLDNKKKNFYIWDGNIIHSDLFRNLKLINGFNHVEYYYEGKYTDHIFTGTLILNKNEVESDSWDGDLPAAASRSEETREMIIDNCHKFLNSDLSWANRYIDTRQVKNIIKETLKRIQK